MDKKILSILVIAICVLLTGCEKKQDLVKYESDLIGFNFEGYVLSSNGNYKKDYADITFKIDSTKLDAFMNEINTRFYKYDDEDIEYFKNSNGYADIIKFCKKENIKGIYHTFRNGEEINTRDIFATICYKDNNYYMKITG